MYDAVKGSFKIIIVVTFGDAATGSHDCVCHILPFVLKNLFGRLMEGVNISRNVWLHISMRMHNYSLNS